MKKSCAALFVILLLFQPVLAAPTNIALPDHVDTVVVPDGSGLTFRKFDGPDRALFKGRLTLSGTYYYGDNQFNDDDSKVDLFLYFTPDAATMARLPFFRIRGRPHDMVLSNSAAFARVVLSRSQRMQLMKKGAPYATGRVTIVVDDFAGEIVCDGPNFDARFVSIVHPKPAAMAQMPGVAC